MIQDIETPEGEVISDAYIINFNEDLWMQYASGTQKACKDNWIKKAEPCEVDEVVLRLHPDAIFPLHGKEKPYIAWRHKFIKSNNGEWIERLTVTVQTDINIEKGTKGLFEKAKKVFTKYPQGTRFKFLGTSGKVLMEHTT